jgi:threonine/homoserine/homoserine lactone efflux protein
MTTTSSLLAFFAVAGLLTITPGLDTILVLRTAASEGRRRAAGAALGIVTGCLFWGIAVALGLGVVLAASPMLFEIVRLGGAAYLAYLGLQLLLRPRRDLASHGEQAEPRASWFMRGLTTNLLNPKVGVFYLSLLPQFIPAGVDVPLFTVLLAGIHAALGLAWFALLIWATRSLARILTRPNVTTWLDRITGGILVAAGLRIGAEAVRTLRT